jgi:phage baseplate assembly protein W
MLDRNTITPVHWQMKRSPEGVALLGEISAEYDDLSQEIRQCILTPKRSVPLNPEKGCDLDQYRDRPMDVRHLFVVAEVREALERDVPRIVLREVIVETSFSQISIKVVWAPSEMVMGEFITTEVKYVF